MKREEKDDMQERNDGTPAENKLEAASSEVIAEAAPHWRSFYAAVRDAIAAMRPDSES